MLTITIPHTLKKKFTLQQPTVLNAFFTWCTAQEKNRLLWTGIILMVHGCVLTPITVLFVVFTGINVTLLTASILAMTFVLIANLAALPTKYTLPTFALSIVADILIIIAALSL